MGFSTFNGFFLLILGFLFSNKEKKYIYFLIFEIYDFSAAEFFGMEMFQMFKCQPDRFQNISIRAN